MTHSDLNPFQIMVVDDTPDSLDLIAQILILRGYRVHPFTNGAAALRALPMIRPDLILLDIMMPDLNGFEVCRRLKADQSTQEIPIIFISALNDTQDKITAFRTGGVDYISKPFQADEVVARVSTHLNLRHAQQRLQLQNSRLSEEIQERRSIETTLQQRNRDLLLLNRISQMFSSSLEFDRVMETILDEVQQLLDVYSISIWLTEPETGDIVCRQAKGPGSEGIVSVRLRPGQGITGWAAQQDESLVIEDTWQDERHATHVDQHTGTPIRSMLTIPLRIQGQVIGVLNLVDLRVGHFSADDLLLLEPIAASAANAVTNARLYTTAQHEIADRKRAEDALRHVNEELQRVNDSKDKFFSIISHDLRGSFNTLLGFAQLLSQNLERYTPDKLRDHIEKLRSSAERLYALLENLLTWSRIQRGALEYEPRHCDLYDLADDNVALFLSRSQQKQVTLHNAVPEQTMAYADPNMVDTVIRNLVSNALKFTRAGDAITIAARRAGDLLEISIADTGVGIDAAGRDKLFRIDTQHTTPGIDGERGTGLGLILCQDLVTRNGGRIGVESQVGVGTTFRFTLPANDPSA
jgi:signal transduction histidine kinase/DNA-binding response OmpR family regulator